MEYPRFNRSALARLLVCVTLLGQIFFSAVSATAAPEVIITVTNTLDSGPGSLRNAILQANSNGASLDVISFDIPGAGPHVIPLISALPVISQPVFIDGLTQTGAVCNDASFVPKVVLAGQSAGAGTVGLDVTAGGTTIQGLVIQRFNSHAIQLRTNGNNTVRCNMIGLNAAGNLDLGNGGAGVYVNNVLNTVINRNVISGNDSAGVQISGGNSGGGQIKDNYIGTDAAGAAAIGNSQGGIRLNGPAGATIGGTNPGDGNLIAGNTGAGIILETNLTANTKIWNNKIGLGANGEPLGNSSFGIYVANSPGNQIGSAGMGNQIVNNGQEGIFINGAAATGNQVQGNFIGLDLATFSNHGNSSFGIQISAASNTLVGGPTLEAGNIIAFNGGDGVYVSGISANNKIIGNLIYSNQGLGIDLGSDGVDPNDAGDSDSGANTLLNFPVLSAIYLGNTVTVFGQFNSLPNQSYRMEVFFNATCDPSGNGEAQFFGAAVDVTTNASGSASFSILLSGVTPSARKITASATDLAGNTSELSACIQAAAAKVLYLPAVTK